MNLAILCTMLINKSHETLHTMLTGSMKISTTEKGNRKFSCTINLIKVKHFADRSQFSVQKILHINSICLKSTFGSFCLVSFFTYQLLSSNPWTRSTSGLSDLSGSSDRKSKTSAFLQSLTECYLHQRLGPFEGSFCSSAFDNDDDDDGIPTHPSFP